MPGMAEAGLTARGSSSPPTTSSLPLWCARPVRPWGFSAVASGQLGVLRWLPHREPRAGQSVTTHGLKLGLRGFQTLCLSPGCHHMPGGHLERAQRGLQA